jgi:transcriptional regulator with XRE-family HTH domain
MKDRILAFLQSENKSYAQFAEEIGVQPSGISHILSGRNNPSLDFVIKMLHRYPSLSADWLLFGREPMYKYASQPTLFDFNVPSGPPIAGEPVSAAADQPESGSDSTGFDMRHDAAEVFQTGPGVTDTSGRKLIRIVFFYADKTFTDFIPS